MKRILHLSDLHFGRADPGLVEPLLRAIDRNAPDLVVISGDLTQRARVSQFQKARALIDRITAPVLVVPGNHDTPLDNLFLRFLRPFHRYRRHINRELEPGHLDDTLAVVGVNTVNRFSWQRGRFSPRTVRRVCDSFDVTGGRLCVAVLHHPLEHGPGVEKRLMKGARAALRDLSECGTDVVLSGHLHQTEARPFTAQPGLLFVQAGTGLSTRLRGEMNTFNVLDCAPGRVEVTAWAADGGRFAPREAARYHRGAEGWTRQGPRRALSGATG
ncbi:metallophosphoesterase family protein [Pseudooceanicola aestuarii]|uniref:metallophosphoesterase family protein n=1 Tax=Pseudooceanicola aestuarii TaxID=2697319 RepID=UPI0013D47512|nr:metallophosphoesterase family protein [Pseudooceanicola aestuarii]